MGSWRSRKADHNYDDDDEEEEDDDDGVDDGNVGDKERKGGEDLGCLDR